VDVASRMRQDAERRWFAGLDGSRDHKSPSMSVRANPPHLVLTFYTFY
jgi:hypothetical protein